MPLFNIKKAAQAAFSLADGEALAELRALDFHRQHSQPDCIGRGGGI
jgi:hypothetical protein